MNARSGPPAQETRPEVLDLAHLSRQTMGDKAVEREVAGLFLDQTARVMRVIRDAAGGTERSDAAHQLKGSARAVGAWRVAAAAEIVEQLASDTPEHLLMKAIADLHATVAEARAAVAAVVDETSAGGL